MIEEISNTWIKPKKWNELPKFRIDDALDINGYKIPMGFITDGGSIPFGFRNSFNPLGKGFPAFIAHDKKCQDFEDRKQANKEFLRDLIDCGVNPRRAKIMYWAVQFYALCTGIK